MLGILLIWLEKLLPFQTKHKRVVILCLFCILFQRQHIILKKVLEESWTKSDQTFFKNLDNTSICYKSEYLQRNLGHILNFGGVFAITENI